MERLMRQEVLRQKVYLKHVVLILTGLKVLFQRYG